MSIFRKNLLIKLLSTVIAITTMGCTLLIFKVMQNEKKNLFEEKVRASQYMAQPILHSLYKDMLDERADLARYLITGIKTIAGVERVQIIRENGSEAAFQDHKTLNSAYTNKISGAAIL